jgi:hypothetical protein
MHDSLFSVCFSPFGLPCQARVKLKLAPFCRCAPLSRRTSYSQNKSKSLRYVYYNWYTFDVFIVAAPWVIQYWQDKRCRLSSVRAGWVPGNRFDDAVFTDYWIPEIAAEGLAR